MQLLPWNNPLVGTAFMLRARRGNLLTSVSLYIVLLVMAYVGWQYYVSLNPMIANNPAQVFLRILFGAQCFISALLMMGQAGGSIKNEVMNKTLDFQRIAATSPWDILMGKLLGTPVMAYMLAFAALPIAVFTLQSGVRGVTLIDLLLMWVQMLTFLFLMGACSIQNTLQVTTQKGTGGSPSFGFFIGVMGIVVYFTYSTSDPSSYLADPRRMTLGALFSPLTAYAGIAENDPWSARFYWFTMQIPCLVIVPIAHLVMSWFFLSIMARRLANPELTALGKTKSYLMLALLDLVAAGMLYSCGRSQPVLGAAGMPLQLQVGVFLIIHACISIVYFISLTPRGEQVMTWIWRFRSRNALADSLLHDRAPNSMAIAVNLLCGTIGVILLCVFSPESMTNERFLPEACLTTAVTVLFLGLLYQALHLGSRKYGSAYFILFIMLFCITPVIVGGIMRSSQAYEAVGLLLLHTTPFTMPLQWVITDTRNLFDVNPYPMVGVYLLLSAWALIYTWRWVSGRTARVKAVKKLLLEGNVKTGPTAVEPAVSE